MHRKSCRVTSLLPHFLKLHSADLQVCTVWSVTTAFWKCLASICTGFEFLFICSTPPLPLPISCICYLSLHGSVFPCKSSSRWQHLPFVRHKAVLFSFKDLFWSSIYIHWNFCVCPGNLLAFSYFTELCLQVCFQPFCWWFLCWWQTELQLRGSACLLAADPAVGTWRLLSTWSQQCCLSLADRWLLSLCYL